MEEEGKIGEEEEEEDRGRGMSEARRVPLVVSIAAYAYERDRFRTVEKYRWKSLETRGNKQHARIHKLQRCNARRNIGRLKGQ